MRLQTLRPRVAAARQTAVRPHFVERPGYRERERTRELVLGERPLCALCAAAGRVAAAVEVDHVVPLHLGGSNARSNLQGLCVPCHERKTAAEAARRAAGG